MSAHSMPPVAAPDVPPHKPYVAPETVLPEFSFSAVVVGAVLGIIFGAASLYMSLKVGMTVSASIPIAVLSITLFRAFTPLLGRNATILENNIVQTTGSAGESIAFGVGVTMPALLILGYDLELARVMVVATLGGLLGILMMIPLRRAFIVKEHGQLTYPEGTACADVLIVGEKGGTSAATVFAGFGLAFVYKMLMSAFRLWPEDPSRRLDTLAGRPFFKGASVSAEVSPELLGVGYIIGTRVSCIMGAGGILAAWVLTPMILLFGDAWTTPFFPATDKLIRDMSVGEIRNNYIIYIGAGAVTAGGIISMFQALPMIFRSLRAGLGGLLGGANAGAAGGPARAAVPRTERDLSMRFLLAGCLAIILAITLAPMLKMNWLGAVLIVLFGFLFVTVSSRLTGLIGSSSNPISGMTVATLLFTCLIFLALGWTTDDHRVTALSVAGIVCIAASNGGTTSQDLKTGFLVGATPRFQQIGILIGALTSALVIGATLLLLNNLGTVYTKKNLPAARINVAELPREKQRVGGLYALEDSKEYFVLHATADKRKDIPPGKYLVDESGAIRYLVDPGVNGHVAESDTGVKIPKYDAPKARLMSSIIDGILKQNLPWSLVLLGIAIAIMLELSGVPSLPFAVGVYLPMSTSAPIFLGGLLRWVVDKWTGRGAAEGEMSPGVLLSSGYIAGGAVAGIFAALLVGLNENVGQALNLGARLPQEWAHSNVLPLIPFGLLMFFLLLVGGGRLLRANGK